MFFTRRLLDTGADHGQISTASAKRYSVVERVCLVLLCDSPSGLRPKPEHPFYHLPLRISPTEVRDICKVFFRAEFELEFVFV
jgi:hypothetical protein